jgi:CheY-like chemotaxis protein
MQLGGGHIHAQNHEYDEPLQDVITERALELRHKEAPETAPACALLRRGEGGFWSLGSGAWHPGFGHAAKLTVRAANCELKNFHPTSPDAMVIGSKSAAASHFFGISIALAVCGKGRQIMQMVCFAGRAAMETNEINNNAMEAKTILYVEDDTVVLTAYRNRLEQEGFQVDTAQDGLEAMKLLSMLVPDLVLLDLVLPKINGAEVLKFIRSHPRLKTVPVIILSTNSFINLAQEQVLESADKRFILLAEPLVEADASPAERIGNTFAIKLAPAAA